MGSRLRGNDSDLNLDPSQRAPSLPVMIGTARRIH
jgi:hypothetical protein